MKKLLRVIAIMLCPILLTSCATIISGKTQSLPVSTNPTGAKVTVNGVKQLSPCILVLDRNIPAYTIVIEKEGYATHTFQLKRGVNGWVFGNIIVGGIIGIVIDAATGSMYQFYPGSIDHSLVPEGETVIELKVE